jgi:hypothetical protein
MRQLAALLLLFVFGGKVVAQEEYAFENAYHVIDTALSEGTLTLSVVNKNFFKNDEYFGDYVEGYTLPGYSIRPTMMYKVARNVSLEAGAELLQYGGTDKYDRVVPYLAAQWQVSRNVRLAMGCIEGAGRASLSEAIYDDEHRLNMLPETGAQLFVEGKKMHFTLWMNWQQFIKCYDTIPEKFMAGVALDYNPTAADAPWQIAVPLRLTVSHIGGQISDYPERMQSLANGSLALRLCRRYEAGFVRRLTLDVEGLFFYTMAGSDVRPFAQGGAFYPKMKIETKLFNAGVGYYMAKDYFALHGNPLFMSLSNYKENYQAKRRMLTFEAHINHSIHRDVCFTLGAKGYYDTDASIVDYWYGFALVITPQWHIIKR